MQRTLVLAAAVATFVSALASVDVAAQSGPTPVNCTTAGAPLDAEEAYMLALINGARATAGVPALDVAGTLSRAAAWKAEDQVAGGGLGEADRLGRSLSARLHDCGYRHPENVFATTGETWASGVTTAQPIFDFWMGSTLVRETLLRPDFTVVGIGRSGNSWVATFASWDDGTTIPGPPLDLPYRTTVPMLAR